MLDRNNEMNPRKRNAINNRIILTERDPTLLPADSNANEVIVQHKAVNNDANSPIWF